MLRSRGFKASIWPRYKSTSCLEVSWFSEKARWMSSMVASVIENYEPLIGLTKMVEKTNSNKSKVNDEEERRDVVGLLVYILVSNH